MGEIITLDMTSQGKAMNYYQQLVGIFLIRPSYCQQIVGTTLF
jgi:hypothetical protein